MELKLDPEAAVSIASAAILQGLNEDQRNNLLEQAVTALLTPEKKPGYYGGSETPLQRAFNQAIAQAAHQAVRESIAEDPRLKAAIDELLGPLLTEAMKSEAQGYSYTLSTKLGDALGSWLAERAQEERNND